jgi:hypothetical protein
MSASSDDILNERKLRAAEMALATARRQRSETDESMRTLQREVADMEAALAEVLAARERDREAARAQVAAARSAQLLAEQALAAERHRRQELEHRLARRARQSSAQEALALQLAAERRIRELEAELEIVFRRAAEFEYGVRMAAFDALKLVRGLVDRVGSALGDVRLPLPAPGRGDPDGGPGQSGPAPGSETVRHGYDAAHPASTGLDSERLDAALERLRASTPPPPEDR